MAQCRSCPAPILWAQTEATDTKPGRPIPLDVDEVTGKALEVEGGNLAIVGSAANGDPIVRYVKAGAGRFRTHFASCPNARQHRKK